MAPEDEVGRTSAVDIVEEVRAILRDAQRGKPDHTGAIGTGPHFLTALQILNRLEPVLRDRLIAERGLPGDGNSYSAVTHVSKALARIQGEVELVYFDNKGVSFDVGERSVRAGYPLCALYRLRLQEDNIE